MAAAADPHTLTTGTMHPRIHEVLESLDRSHTAVEEELAAIPDPLRHRRPAENRWSIAEILEHLGLVEERVLRLFEARVTPDRLREVGAEQTTESVLPTLDVNPLLDRSHPLTAPDGTHPQGGMSAAQAWSDLNRRRETLRALILAADGRALGSITAEHARLGTLNMYQWLLFLAAHEARHLSQIRETGAEVMQPEARA